MGIGGGGFILSGREANPIPEAEGAVEPVFSAAKPLGSLGPGLLLPAGAPEPLVLGLLRWVRSPRSCRALPPLSRLSGASV